jgi:hypothetical protein
MDWPQPLSIEVWHRPAHGLPLGVQHVPRVGSQTPPPAHMPFTPHVTGWPQLSSV